MQRQVMSPGGSLTIIKSLKALIAGAACSPWVAFIGEKKRSKESARSLLTKPACPVPPVQAAQRAQSRPLVSSALSLRIKRKQNIKSFPKRSHLKAPPVVVLHRNLHFLPQTKGAGAHGPKLTSSRATKGSHTDTSCSSPCPISLPF